MHTITSRISRYFVLISIVLVILFCLKVYRHQLPVDSSGTNRNYAVTCNMSMGESDQFLCETEEEWRKRRHLYSSQREKNMLTMNEYKDYFYKNWFPEFQCKKEVRVGSGDGGKWACDIERLKMKSSCLIYSFGSSGDFSFEQAIHKQLPHCSVHTLDMRKFDCPTDVCTFHLVKIGDGLSGSKTLHQFMRDINHTNQEIDILKIDVESGEYPFFNTLFSNNEINRKMPSVYIRQILIEVHLDSGRVFETSALFQLFNAQNYVIYHRELNVGYPYYACEYGLLKLNRHFFRGHV